jgi:fructose 1,6-bisphosphatase
LQSEPHKSLFKRLHDITARVKAALRDQDTEALQCLAFEHKTVMDKLNQNGLSTNVEMIHTVGELSDDVHDVIAEISKRRDEIAQQLLLFGKRKKVAYAYARNA